MKFYFITSQFRILIRTIDTTLDILMLKSIDVSCEIKKLVYLVAKRSQKTEFEIDPDNKDCLTRVNLILDHFKNCFKLQPSIIKKVLYYLEIKDWIFLVEIKD